MGFSLAAYSNNKGGCGPNPQGCRGFRFPAPKLPWVTNHFSTSELSIYPKLISLYEFEFFDLNLRWLSKLVNQQKQQISGSRVWKRVDLFAKMCIGSGA